MTLVKTFFKMFEIMRNLVNENKRRQFVPEIEKEIINVFCDQYPSCRCDDIYDTLNEIERFVKKEA